MNVDDDGGFVQIPTYISLLYLLVTNKLLLLLIIIEMYCNNI